MDKSAYKIMLFILLLPINIIKYFCIGLYFVGSVLIKIVLYIILFSSFLVYKSVKCFFLFFALPIVIYNMIKRVKQGKAQLKQNLSIKSDNKNINETVLEPIVLAEAEAKNNFDEEPVEIDNFNKEELEEEQSIEINDENIEEDNSIVEINDEHVEEDNSIVETSKENFAENLSDINTLKVKKEKKPLNLKKHILLPLELVSYPVYKAFKYLLLGLVQVSNIIYKLFKYLLLGINYSLILIYRAFTYLSFFVYKLFKYMLFSLGLPIIIKNIIFIKNKDKLERRRILREQRKLKQQEEKFKKQLVLQQKQEDKLREQLDKKKRTEEYINENVKVEKKTFKQKFDELLNNIFSFPTIVVEKIKNAIHNSVFAKNRRNKYDISRQALLIDFQNEDTEKSDIKLVYQYTAKNKEGKIVTDYFEAFSKVEVHSFLLSEGYEVYNIKTNKWIQFLHQKESDSKVRMKNKDLIFFLTQLSTYIKAGIPLVESLKILARQYSKNKRYERLFKTIIYDLSTGDNFSTALSKRGDAFPKILINMVKASEMTGELPEVLDDMAEYFTQMDKTRKQMITALTYPIIILIVSIAVIVFILLFVIPKFVDIYKSMDASKIPTFTLAVLAVSDFLKNYSLYLLIGIMVVTILLVYLYKNVKVFKTLCQWIFMHTPVIKDVIIYNEVTTFTKTFASLLSHNVYITDSMEILTKITNNEIYKMLILDTITNLAKGEKISTSFKDHWAFPLPAYEMLVTGEQTGQLPEMMAKVADYYQDLHANTVTRIKTFVEPILIVFLTVIVGIIVMSIIIPMFGMYQTVQDFS